MIVGVGNMHELGASSTGNVSVYGPARNPWNTERCPGGSSSGPAAAVAARLVAGAVGADGVGSIRYPAAYCGLTGLKPTFGRSAMAGHHMAEVSTTIVSGALCADAADCRLLDSALFGEELAAGEPRGLRIGVIAGEVTEDVAPAVREACEAAIEDLRRETGGEVREIELPELAAATLATVLIANSESLGGITPERLNDLDPELSPLGRGLLKYRLLLPAIATIKAAAGPDDGAPDASPGSSRRSTCSPARRCRRWRRRWRRRWSSCPRGTLTADEANVRGGALANLTGIPAISVPVGSLRRAAGRPAAAGRLGARRAAARRRRGDRARQRPPLGRGDPARARRRAAGGLACRRSRSRGSSAPSARSSPCRASTSRSTRARSTASSAPTAPARRRRCGC